ncbi:MAG: two-component system, chemotaxis family, sensor histidine kinase and response regulator WspE [Frankiaceae bacterium]|nr:two-component system, chemotaxis family, sensor histidine kinase and response regulator WspE [Frankiaceae bacterium]
MAGWADDPELLATFRAEVEERVASLQAGLLALEAHPSPRQVVASLFRDAHTVKGSARMLGLAEVLAVAHSAEDLLGALRDGRLGVRRDLVDLLLASCDGIAGALPGVDEPVPDEHLHALADAMQRAIDGEEPVVVPLWVPQIVEDEDAVDDALRRGGDSVRVTTAKVYELIDVVGEAELDARRLERAGTAIDGIASDSSRWLRALREALAGTTTNEDATQALTRLLATDDQMLAASRDLRELAEDAQGRLSQVRDGAMGLAMVPVRRVVAGLPRVVRDLAAATGKDVRLVLQGQDVELDKQVLDGVSDALKHLVVNAVDHGCEPAAARVAAGKPAHSTVTITARAAGGTVVIEVADDGAGIDEEQLRTTAISRGLLLPDSALSGQALHSVLFTPGFSTADEVTETSGRGIGLDVVRSAVEGLGGLVELRSSAQGTTFALTLPVTLGVLRCLMARLGGERFALPVPGIVESLSLKNAVVHSLAGNPVVVRHGETLPLLDLGAALGVTTDRAPSAAVVVRHGDRQVAWAVDALDGERELVVKDLGAFLGRPPVISGATIDGDGSVVCLVDLRELGDESAQRGTSSYSNLVAPGDGEATALRRPRVLVVEDSVGVRELERAILESAGYDVMTAVDGTDGASRLGDDPADLVLSDVEMPGMDGYALTRTIRRTRGWEQVPVIIMTSRGSDDDQRAGLDAGASAYLLKTEFDQEQLVETVRRLVGR